jgi:hypothetical protein
MPGARKVTTNYVCRQTTSKLMKRNNSNQALRCAHILVPVYRFPIATGSDQYAASFICVLFCGVGTLAVKMHDSLICPDFTLAALLLVSMRQTRDPRGFTLHCHPVFCRFTTRRKKPSTTSYRASRLFLPLKMEWCGWSDCMIMVSSPGAIRRGENYVSHCRVTPNSYRSYLEVHVARY